MDTLDALRDLDVPAVTTLVRRRRRRRARRPRPGARPPPVRRAGRRPGGGRRRRRTGRGPTPLLPQLDVAGLARRRARRRAGRRSLPGVGLADLGLRLPDLGALLPGRRGRRRRRDGRRRDRRARARRRRASCSSGAGCRRRPQPQSAAVDALMPTTPAARRGWAGLALLGRRHRGDHLPRPARPRPRPGAPGLPHGAVVAVAAVLFGARALVPGPARRARHRGPRRRPHPAVPDDGQPAAADGPARAHRPPAAARPPGTGPTSPSLADAR